MKLLQMKYFQTVCKYGGITKAAEELFVSQPTISFCIKELEEEFGVKLFHRKHNRLQLTVEGTYFLDKVNYILQSVDTLASQMKDMGNNRNHVKLAVPAMISTFLFPQLFNSYNKAFPDVELEMVETSSLQTRKLVDAFSVDLGITILDANVTESYNVLPLLSTELVFCVSKSHPLAGRTHISFSELADERIIMFKADSYQNIFINRAFSEVGVEPKVVLNSSQLYTIKQFLSYGNAGAFLYRQLAEKDQDLVCIPLDQPIIQDIVLIWAKSGNLYSDAENFIQFAKLFKYE
ncbi:MAG: LysR family transcriptional regulator [Clostridia bacterium]|nr:LysR family transcriptional regulator [Clostridia bacterium]